MNELELLRTIEFMFVQHIIPRKEDVKDPIDIKNSYIHALLQTKTYQSVLGLFPSRAISYILTLNSLSRIKSRLGQVEELVCFTDEILPTVRDPTSLSAQH